VKLNNIFVGSGAHDGGMNGIELAHSITLTIIWIILIDLAIWVKYLYSFRYRILTYAILMFVVLVATIVLVILIIANKKPKISKLASPFKAHYVIGLIVLAWVALHVIIGILHRVLLRYTGVNPYTIRLLRKMDKYSCIILILLGKTNVILGWAIKGSVVGLAVASSIMSLSLILLLVYIYWISGSLAKEVFALRIGSKYNDRWSIINGGMLTSPLSDPTVLALMTLPYCWP
jgi:hypothetical protein